MKRKMMTKETIPNNSTTNGGNGSYMRRKVMTDPKRGGHKYSANMKPMGTATGRAVLKSM